MAALRSGMAMLGRRCSGSSSAACMGGKVFRPAPPPLHPAAVRKLESWRRFSTGGCEPKDKPESFPRILWQWAKYRVKNADPVTKSKAVAAYGVVVMGAPTIFLIHVTKNCSI
ncbi:uncharacterized protein LOC110434172 [Sorghum bicolor]|uniref:Uncharacterized protein n=1 Tax=Sorghum bicolor TaxID=4558 RepID=A0A1B6Q132_SORBI|nr:uncharacterized protein LOC110434172 [Sorghum bicolor]KXG31634.1 hypothetical protein SORBI_3003G032800 [Sorghum bicolor]|eukprot:XP_021313641.1 uncharacterized protein LOC110434172 [Sorghum bicolor]